MLGQSSICKKRKTNDRVACDSICNVPQYSALKSTLFEMWTVGNEMRL
jgi:hypothetical protein